MGCECEFLTSDGCTLVRGLLASYGVNGGRAPHPAACEFCRTKAVPPQAVNEVVVNLATVAVADNRELVGRIVVDHLYLLQRRPPHPQFLEAVKRLEGVKSGNGVGSQLWRLLESLGVKHTATCACLSLAVWMNEIGPGGCQAERAELAGKMRANAKEYGWGTVATAAGKALLTGIAWRLDLADVYGSLLDEAVRRAEQAGAKATVAVPPKAYPTKPSPLPGAKAKSRQRIVLQTNLCPGDLLTLTAAVESLHRTYPGEYEVGVKTNHPDIWRHNPGVSGVKPGQAGVRTIDCHYPSIQRCNEELIPFLGGYTEHLGEQLSRPLRLRTNRPHLYLSPEEAGRPLSNLWPGAPDLESLAAGRPIWLVVAGVKNDFTIKGWPIEHFQRVVSETAGKICWVQIGLKKHNHPQLQDVVSLLDSGPPMRETIILASRAAGGLGPVTFLQHLIAAWEKPYICLVGGREPAPWVQYPYQHTLHTVGRLDCCARKSCWRARVVKLPDKDAKNNSLCQYPVVEGLARPAARCMEMIRPEEVIGLLGRLV